MKTINEKKHTLGSILPCKSNCWPALIALCASLLSLPAYGATLSWSGSGAPDGNWSNDANWGFAGHPASGDTLVFSAAQPNQINTNNIGSLILNQIRFVGAGGGYDLRGLAFTLTNNIEATNSAGANTIENNIALANMDQIVDVAASLTLSGVLSGSMGLVKNGTGTLLLNGPFSNTYGGTTTVNAGTVQLAKAGFPTPAQAIPGNLVIGNGTVAATVQNIYSEEFVTTANVTINNGSSWDMNGNFETIGNNLTFNGSANMSVGNSLTLTAPSTVAVNGGTSSINGTGSVQLGAGPCGINVVSGTLKIFPSVQGVAAITKTGLGNLYLYGPNTYSGLTTISQGWLWAENSLALGATSSGTSVSNGATLVVQGGLTISNESLTLNGPGEPNWAALDCESFETNIWAGPITLTADSTFGNYGGGTLRIIGPIGGAGGLQEIAGGYLSLEGATANTYGGTTTVKLGTTLLLNKTSFIVAAPGNLDVYGTLRLAGNEEIASGSDVNLESGGLFDFSTFYAEFDTLHGLGTVNFGVSGWITVGINSGSSEFDGPFTGTGWAPGWTVGKEGSGTFTIGGNSTYTAGITHVLNGKLVVNGLQPLIPVQVDSGATLGGSGTVGAITDYGTIATGNGPGILNSSNVTFSAAPANLTVDLDGPTPGTGYDQLNVTGTATLANATLTVVPAFTTPVAVGQQFVIINNDAADAVTGTFNGLPGGATISAGGYKFTISYVGGTGNDVVLTLADVPAATLGSLSTVAAGNGDGMIAPNECNNFGIVITNKTATPMTGVSATLASTTPGVIVTESAEPYSNIAGNGLGTNTAPFLIATTPGFVCGTDFNLTLTVTTASHGSFVVPVVVPTGRPSLASVRFDNNNITNVPDIGTIESTNIVAAWSGGPITKVAVSLWLVAPFSSDMSLSLIAPDGTTVPLASGVGAGANFGSGSADGNRTTFDDAAATAITAGSSPFVGTFRPQSPLSAFIGTSPVGAWRLHIADGFGSGSPDTLRAWSLFLNGTDCGTGSGICELCPNVTLTSALGPSSPTQTNYVTLGGGPSVCGVPKACPGTTSLPPYPSEMFTFHNGPSDACVTVILQDISVGGGMVSAAYTGSFNPADPNSCDNYLGDMGAVSTPGLAQAYSLNVASNATFVVNVIGGSYGSYKLTVTGGDCRPALKITDVGAGKAKLDWTTAAAGYQLESTNTLASGSSIWSAITNPAVVVGGRFQVTNTVPSANQFYHLRKP